MRQLEDLLRYQPLLKRLCELNARTPVIQDLVSPDITEGTIKAFYRNINNGKAPTSGQLPQELKTVLATPRRRCQASVIICCWERFVPLVDSSAWRYIKTYEQYERVYADDQLYDFTRNWFIIRQFVQRRIAATNCRHCKQRYVYNREDASDLFKCPICSLLKIRPPEEAEELRHEFNLHHEPSLGAALLGRTSRPIESLHP